jgi:hypothetical protein
MRVKTKGSLFLLVIIVALAIFALLPVDNGLAGAVKTTPTAQYQDPEGQALPVVIYATEQEVKTVDPQQQALRIARGKRYDNPSVIIKDEPLEPFPVNGHWWHGLPSLPVVKSDAIVIGMVDDAKAYLSNNKKGIYSEFTISIQETLKVKNGILAPTTSIVAERFGGAVQFPSGRVYKYRINDQGVPRIGQQYVFFLRYNEQGEDFSIITGYELRDEKVFPLDGRDTKLQFSIYQGTSEDTFLSELRNVIASPEQESPENGGSR